MVPMHYGLTINMAGTELKGCAVIKVGRDIGKTGSWLVGKVKQVDGGFLFVLGTLITIPHHSIINLHIHLHLVAHNHQQDYTSDS